MVLSCGSGMSGLRGAVDVEGCVGYRSHWCDEVATQMSGLGSWAGINCEKAFKIFMGYQFLVVSWRVQSSIHEIVVFCMSFKATNLNPMLPVTHWSVKSGQLSGLRLGPYHPSRRSSSGCRWQRRNNRGRRIHQKTGPRCIYTIQRNASKKAEMV